jgi:hypothetical protein
MELPVQTSVQSPTNGVDSGHRNVHAKFFQFDLFNDGSRDPPLQVAITGFANTSADMELSGATPADHASLQLSLNDLLDLNAFGRSTSASGMVVSSATSQGVITITSNKLDGSYSAMLSIDATATVGPATVDLKIADSFKLSLRGKGFVGDSITLQSHSGGTVSIPSQTAQAVAAANTASTFDLARFVAAVLGTGQFDLSFLASTPGVALQGVGTSVETIDATADIVGRKPQTYHDTDRVSFSFSEVAHPGAGMLMASQDTSNPLLNVIQS